MTIYLHEIGTLAGWAQKTRVFASNRYRRKIFFVTT